MQLEDYLMIKQADTIHINVPHDDDEEPIHIPTFMGIPKVYYKPIPHPILAAPSVLGAGVGGYLGYRGANALSKGLGLRGSDNKWKRYADRALRTTGALAGGGLGYLGGNIATINYCLSQL